MLVKEPELVALQQSLVVPLELAQLEMAEQFRSQAESQVLRMVQAGHQALWAVPESVLAMVELLLLLAVLPEQAVLAERSLSPVAQADQVLELAVPSR